MLKVDGILLNVKKTCRSTSIFMCLRIWIKRYFSVCL